MNADRERLLDEVVTAYLKAVEAGDAPDRDQLLARHPELATDLASFFAAESHVGRVAAPLRAAADEPTSGLGEPQPAGPGTRVGYFGDYELVEEIGRGGMGVVYKARQVSLKRIVALKMILTGQLAGGDDVRRFHAEAEAAAKLDHPGIVSVFEVGQHEGHHYFSMAFVEGQSLARQLVEGLPAPRQAAELIKKVAEAVAYAHLEGVVHRDLKPANILIDAAGQPRLTDFGLAKRVTSEPGASQTGDDLTRTGQVLGTPSYMPPEQASGQRGAVGPLSDVYSLGAVLYAMLTGRPPFQAATPLDTLMQVLEQEPAPPRQLNRSVPRDLETICLKCLAKEPNNRYASARELATDLERFLNGQPIHARPATRRERLVKWVRRRPAAAALLGVSAAAALCLVGLGIALVVNARRLADEAGKRETAEHDRANLLNDQVAAGRNHVYSSDISLAALAFENDDSQTMANYLDGVRPKPGEADLRGFEWRYLWRKNNLERLNLLKTGVVSAGPGADEMQREWVEPRRRLANQRLLAFSPDGKYLATTRDVCDAATGKVLIEYDDVKGSKIFFSHDGTVLFAGWRLFDLTKQWSLTPQERGKGGFTIPHDAANRLVPLGFLGKQNAFVVMTDWQPARKWDAQKTVWIDLPVLKPALKTYDVTGKETVYDFAEHKGMPIEDACLAVDSGLLAVATGLPNSQSEGLQVDVLDLVQGGRKTLKIKVPQDGEATELRLSPDGATLAIYRPGSIILCDAAAVMERTRLDVRDIASRSLSFSADSKTLLLLGGDGYGAAKVKAWHIATGKEVGDWQGRNNNVGKSMDILGVLSPDGKTIATASSEKPYWPADSIVRLWDTATGKLRAKFLGHRHQVYDIIFSPDGKSLATLDEHSTGGSLPLPPNVNVKVWDMPAPLAGEGEGPPIGLPLDTSMITTFDCSPDGKTAAVGFANGKIQLCEAASLKVLKTLGQDSAPVRAGQKRSSIPRGMPVDVLMFSPDGKQLAAAHVSTPFPYISDRSAGNIDIWDVTGDTVTAPLPGFLKATRAFDGKLLAVTSIRGPVGAVMPANWGPHSLTVWDVAAKKSRLEVKDGVMCAFSPDGRFAALGAPVKPPNSQCRIKIWESATGAERLLPGAFYALTGSQELIHSLVYSPDGKYLALASIMDLTPEGTKDEDRRTGYAVRLYDVATGQSIAFIPQQWPAVFSPDGKVLATISGSGPRDRDRSKITLWDPATGKELGVFSNPDKLWCDHPMFSPDGKSFAVLTIAEWTRRYFTKVIDGKFLDGTEISMTQASPSSWAINGTPGRQSSLSLHPVHEIHVWDVPSSLTPLANGETRELNRRNRFIVAWHGTVEAIAFGHDNRTVYTLAHFDQPMRTAPTASRLQVWDAATGMERGVVGDHGTKFHALAYTEDGRLLAATQQHLNVRVPDEYFLQHKMRLWDVKQQKELTPPQMVTENALPMSVDPKSLTLTSATPAVTNDGAVQAQMNGEEVKLTERATGKVLHLLKGNKGASRLAFSPDGKTLAVGMPDGTIRLWNVAAGRQLLAIQAHTGGVTGLAFHADGRVLASSSDTEIRLWHTSE